MLLRHITYFLAVAEHQSFTRAAAALYVSQPALSQQIRQLEQNLDTVLFDRSGRTVRLTDAGEVYLHYARSALQELNAGKRALQDVADLSRGSLRIAVTPTFTSWLVGPLLGGFYQRYPGIALNMREMSQEKMETLLIDGELDIGVGFDGAHSAEIAARELLTETLSLMVNRHHPLASRRSLRPAALNGLPLVLLSAEFATREQIDRQCAQKGIRPQVVIEANSIGAVLEILQRTSLATLLPTTLSRDSSDRVAVPFTPAFLQRKAVLLQRRDAVPRAATRAFIELALALAAGGDAPAITAPSDAV